MQRIVRRLVHTERVLKDVVVIGGGPAGLSVVTALQSSPSLRHLDVSLVESQPMADKFTNWHKAMPEKEFENRVISITPNSTKFLDKIGAWENVLHDRTLSYDEMRVWDGESSAAIDFDGWSSDTGIIATMIENSNVQQALYRTGDTSSKVIHASVTSIDRAPNGFPVVKLSNNQEIETRLLIGADGQQSPVRKYAQIESRGWDYNRFGVVGTLQLEYDNFRNVAYQRFLRTGPLAILPLPGDRATMVWSTIPERAQWLKKLAPEAVTAMVNAGIRLEMVDIDYLHTLNPENTSEIVDEVSWRLEQRLANSAVDLQIEDDNNLPVMVENVVEGSVAAFPLRMRHADSYIAERVALVGDAAHATHPLSGQGLNMGQRDVQSLVSALELAVSRGLDIGSTMALEPYPKEAYTKNHLLLGVNDKLHKLYSTDLWPIVQIRSMGLNFVNSVPWVKQLAMVQAQ